MTAAGAAARLDTEAFAQTPQGTYRQSQNHEGHGCCRDASRFGTLARAQGKGSLSIVGFAVDSGMRAVVLPLTCRRWSCSCCAARLRARARARAFMGASGAKVMLLTLTIDPSDPRLADPRNRAGKSRPRSSALLSTPQADTIEASVRYASWAWNRMRANLSNRHGAVPYFRGLELQKSGIAHLHVLIRVRDAAEFMKLRALIRGPESDRGRGLAVMAGFGKVVDAQLARSGGDVARYVTKMRDAGAGDAAAYATKGIGAALPRYTRRAAWSLPNGRAPWAAGWRNATPIAGFDWRVARASVETVSEALALSDFHVVDPATYRIRPGNHPGEGSA